MAFLCWDPQAIGTGSKKLLDAEHDIAHLREFKTHQRIKASSFYLLTCLGSEFCSLKGKKKMGLFNQKS